MLGNPGQLPTPLWASMSLAQPPPFSPWVPCSLAPNASWAETIPGPVGSMVGQGASHGTAPGRPHWVHAWTCLPLQTCWLG